MVIRRVLCWGGSYASWCLGFLCLAACAPHQNVERPHRSGAPLELVSHVVEVRYCTPNGGAAPVVIMLEGVFRNVSGQPVVLQFRKEIPLSLRVAAERVDLETGQSVLEFAADYFGLDWGDRVVLQPADVVARPLSAVLTAAVGGRSDDAVGPGRHWGQVTVSVFASFDLAASLDDFEAAAASNRDLVVVGRPFEFEIPEDPLPDACD